MFLLNGSPFRPLELFLVVALVKSLVLSPRSCEGGCLRTYRVNDEGDRLELVHETPVDDFPASVCAFQGRLLVGVGNRLRIYDLGRKKLLKKCENKVSPEHRSDVLVLFWILHHCNWH